jgi:hypothetical protein
VTSTRRPIICLTPVKNEAWILDSFLQCASLWADHIVVADQGSTDESVKICERFPKVKLIHNTTSDYSEQYRQELLLNAAREIHTSAILIALDADEFLSSNFLTSAEWQELRSLDLETVVEFSRVDLECGTDVFFYHSVDDAKFAFPFGYVDRGAAHQGILIHSTRVPYPANTQVVRLKDVVVLHYQFVCPGRVASKHRWYMCFERLKYPQKSTKAILETYTWMHARDWPRRSTKTSWLSGYRNHGINVDHFPDDGPFWWDWEVLRMFARFGVQHFADLKIWDVDWEAIRQQGSALRIDGLPRTPVRVPRVYIPIRERLRKLFRRFI